MPTFAKAPVSRLRRPAARQFRSNRWKEYFGGALLGEGAQLRSSWDEQLTASRPEPRSGTGVCRQRIAESTDRAGRNRDPCHSGSKKLFLIARQWTFPRPWAERKRIQGSAPGLSKSHCRAFSCPGSLRRTWLGLGRSKRLLFLVGGFGFRGAGIGLLGLVFRGLLLVLLRVFLPCAQLLGNRIEMLAQHGVLFRRQLLRIVQQTYQQLDRHQLLARLLDQRTLFRRQIGPVDADAQTDDLFLERFAHRVAGIAPDMNRKFHHLQQQVVSRLENRQIVINSHLTLFSSLLRIKDIPQV